MVSDVPIQIWGVFGNNKKLNKEIISIYFCFKYFPRKLSASLKHYFLGFGVNV